MKLRFSNPSRSFDETQSRILFWGYDKTIEISFFLEFDALIKISPETTRVEKELLLTFDKARTRIYEVANKKYESAEKRTFAYIITAKDFT